MLGESCPEDDMLENELCIVAWVVRAVARLALSVSCLCSFALPLAMALAFDLAFSSAAAALIEVVLASLADGGAVFEVVLVLVPVWVRVVGSESELGAVLMVMFGTLPLVAVAVVLLVRLSVLVFRFGRDLVLRPFKVRASRSLADAFDVSHSKVLVSLVWLSSPDEICRLTAKVSKTGDQGPSMLVKFKFPPQSASQQGKMFKNMGLRES
jgi:hypothetical protein